MLLSVDFGFRQRMGDGPPLPPTVALLPVMSSASGVSVSHDTSRVTSTSTRTSPAPLPPLRQVASSASSVVWYLPDHRKQTRTHCFTPYEIL